MISNTTFSGDIPDLFINNYAHWLDIAAGEVEFRPLSTLWHSHTTEWRLGSLGRTTCRLQGRDKTLIEPSSHIGLAVFDILQVLDSYANIRIILGHEGNVEIELYRYNLHFSITSEARLRCDEYGYNIHPIQSIGTWIGLQNMLVLESDTYCSDDPQLTVLVPYGSVQFKKLGRHVDVSIEKTRSAVQKHYLFTVNHYIHDLCGVSDTLGLLYKAYLHAVTSHVLPDDLTKRTGTQQALEVLQGAAVFSCYPLEYEVVSLLDKIAELTPRRTYYPPHLTRMQEVSWDNRLSQLSQHGDYEKMANAINDHSKRFATLHDAKPAIVRPRGAENLLRRARTRNYAFQARISGAYANAPCNDEIYRSRDKSGKDNRLRRVYEVASLVKEWPTVVNTDLSLLNTMKTWQTIGGFNQTFTKLSLQELMELDIRGDWGSLYDLCRFSSKEQSTWRLMFTFCAITFGHAEESDCHLRTLLACAFSREFTTIDPPRTHTLYNLEPGYRPTRSALTQTIMVHKNRFFTSRTNPPSHFNKRRKSEWRVTNQHTMDLAFTQMRSEMSRLEDFIYNQWPTDTLRTKHLGLMYLNEIEAQRQCQESFHVWYKNQSFVQYIGQVEAALTRTWCMHGALTLLVETLDQSPSLVTRVHLPSLEDLLEKRSTACDTTMEVHSSLPSIALNSIGDSGFTRGASMATLQYTGIENIVSQLSSGGDHRRKEYAAALEASLQRLKDKDKVSPTKNMDISLDYKTTRKQLSHDRDRLRHSHDSIIRSISPSTAGELMLEQAGLWPGPNRQLLLRQLCPDRFLVLHEQWKNALISLGRNITALQRSARLLFLLSKGDSRAAQEEVQNTSITEWLPYDYPGWLLLEIENDITIRSLQIRVAMEMIQPSSHANSVLQLNMGEGKSSIIMIMIAAACADQKCLLRAIVLKPLLRQTMHLLTQRLGGLLNQRVYHTPFSRRTQLDGSVVEDLQSIYEDCKQNRGILVALPEHILSFRLMGRERFSNDLPLATRLLKVENWLELNCRDVLDESDEILDVRSQLVYTVGSQEMLDGQPDRWLTAQGLLHRVAIQAAALSEARPNFLEIDPKGKGFPFIQFFDPTAVSILLELVVKDVFDGHVGGLSFDFFGSKVRRALERFVRNRDVSMEDLTTVTDACSTSLYYSSLLLLRGMFAYNILSFAVSKKRWLVEYGLDPRRCLMAVPYRAKGVPSINAEWGHPDVAILLTCLSYYHTGLTDEQIRQSFGLLIKDANAADEYSRWCESCSIPDNLRALEAVNLEDVSLCHSELFPHLRYSQGLANFFMRMIVFPKEGKVFKKKISTSAWDIPSTQLTPMNLTTGFSGTNDNRFLLPLSIKQRDLPELLHTNAFVVNLILKPENSTYIRAADDWGKKLDTPHLLSLITRQHPRITVLIDVGAQLLDLTNQQVACAWLAEEPNAECALFFNAEDEATLVDRRSVIVPLRTSPFRSKLDQCLIYLDEVHTRGIDLTIPSGVKAAVTLGPRLMKDRLVQGRYPSRKRKTTNSKDTDA